MKTHKIKISEYLEVWDVPNKLLKICKKSLDSDSMNFYIRRVCPFVKKRFKVIPVHLPRLFLKNEKFKDGKVVNIINYFVSVDKSDHYVEFMAKHMKVKYSMVNIRMAYIEELNLIMLRDFHYIQ